MKKILLSLLISLSLFSCIGEKDSNVHEAELIVIEITDMPNKKVYIDCDGKQRIIKFDRNIFGTDWVGFLNDYKFGRLGTFIVLVDDMGSIYGIY